MSEIEKLPLTSMDIKVEQIAKMKQLFPEVFIEGDQIDWERLKLTLGENVAGGAERFGMTWPGKRDCFRTIQQPSIGTLVPAREESVDFDTTQNLFIEGDNLEVLKLLQKSYLGKVKMIYIDPPYNTGNEFIYPDNFSENLNTYLEYTGQIDGDGKKFSTNMDTDGRFHSKWMNMMYPRLFLARNLLREDGVIFISIDDHEVTNLRAICNEVFGEENFVATLVYDKNRKNDAKYFSVGHEYMLVYFRNSHRVAEEGTRFRIAKEGVDEVKAEFVRLRSQFGSDWDAINLGLKNLYATWNEGDDRRALARFTKVDEKGPYRDDGDISWPGGGGPKYELLHPVTKKPCKVPDAGWRFPKVERMKEEILAGRVVFGEDETTLPKIRRNLFESDRQVMRSVHFSYAQTSTLEFNRLFNDRKVFENPKSVTDIRKLIEYISDANDNEIVMDFFAGSGTTAHAMFELNYEDHGNRRFICVQLPEPTSEMSEARASGFHLVSDVTKSRIRKAIQIVKERCESGSDLFKQEIPAMDLGFKVFKLSPSNFKVWEANASNDPEEVQGKLFDHTSHLSPEAKQEAILYELLLKSGFELTTPIEKLEIEGKTVYSIAEGELLICLERQLTLEVLKAMAEMQPSRVICLDEGFVGADADAVKTNAVQIMKSKGVLNFRTV